MLLLRIWQQIKEARCPCSDGGLPFHNAFEYFLSEETIPALLEASKDSNALPLHKAIEADSSKDFPWVLLQEHESAATEMCHGC
jgi:hypothetical protein